MVDVTIVVYARAGDDVEPHVRAKAKRLHKNFMRAANDGAAGVSPWPPSAPPPMAVTPKVNSVARELAIRAPAPEFMLPRAPACAWPRKSGFTPTPAVAGDVGVGATSPMPRFASSPPSNRAAGATDPENDVLLGLNFQHQLD